MDTLHIPEHIRFECSGCGNCCLQWPVPATAEDVGRIEALCGGGEQQAQSELEADLRAVMGKASAAGFRRMNAGDSRFRGFTHMLDKRQDGRCRFLSENNGCTLHHDFGPAAKPAMCRLFPHAFSHTPTGVYAYVSFASSAVLFNQGRLLTEQQELLAERYRLYRELFPESQPDWSRLQILDGFPIVWGDFLELEHQFMPIVTGNDHTHGTILAKLHAVSRVICEALPRTANPEKLPPLEASPQVIDQIILKHLENTYLPPDVFGEDNFDLDSQTLMGEIVGAPQAVSFAGIDCGDLKRFVMKEQDEQTKDLLQRFVYARLFAKLYFGPNLGHLSLLSGVHHLFFVVALAQLKLKALAIKSGKQVDFQTAAEVIRTIERRLSQMNFSAQSSAVMEVLFSSPTRLQRVRRLVE